ncbi:hypothetical protein VP01_7301g1 [Puccinia sorghi]|uniref:Uncharacterized protein n=1 Tax=Puccinia sorghi TaxID=27349 RepID=A0A0L6UCW3_9BASI|nr:hypothetical protein VP01_7301g1 [Puccinia sorghi]
MLAPPPSSTSIPIFLLHLSNHHQPSHIIHISQSIMASCEIIRETKVLLTTENYALWLLPIKFKLHKIKGLNIVTGAVACPDPKKDKDKARLYHLSQEVLTLVSSNLLKLGSCTK